jgi:hypothetical protein
MRSLAETRDAMAKELKGSGFNVHHHQDRKQDAVVEMSADI